MTGAQQDAGDAGERAPKSFASVALYGANPSTRCVDCTQRITAARVALGDELGDLVLVVPRQFSGAPGVSESGQPGQPLQHFLGHARFHVNPLLLPMRDETGFCPRRFVTTFARRSEHQAGLCPL